MERSNNVSLKVISHGDEILLHSASLNVEDKAENRECYRSIIYEILSEDTLEIIMLIDKNKWIPLNRKIQYEIYFYTKRCPYKSLARIIDSYRKNNIYIIQLKLASSLNKQQRREFYRYSCLIEMELRRLTEEEIQKVESMTKPVIEKNLPLDKGVIVDISAGGCSFISQKQFEIDNLIYCTYELLKEECQKRYEVIVKVLAVKKLKNKKDTFECRGQFYNIDEKIREDIIKYIFEDERKKRKSK